MSNLVMVQQNQDFNQVNFLLNKKKSIVLLLKMLTWFHPLMERMMTINYQQLRQIPWYNLRRRLVTDHKIPKRILCKKQDMSQRRIIQLITPATSLILTLLMQATLARPYLHLLQQLIQYWIQQVHQLILITIIVIF